MNNSGDYCIHSDINSCVLSPRCDKGVLIETYVDANIDNVQSTGIYSNREAYDRRLTNRNRSYLNGCVFFRPIPTYKNVNNRRPYYVRVDPDKTYVFDQEFHARMGSTHREPKLLLSKYLQDFMDAKKNKDEEGYMFYRTLYTPEFKKYPYDNEIEGNTDSVNAHLRHEVRIEVDILPPEWLVNVGATW